MNPRRWAYLCAASDATGRPLVEPEGVSSFNTVSLQGAGNITSGRVGSMQGLPVYVSTNVPTTVSGSSSPGYPRSGR